MKKLSWLDHEQTADGGHLERGKQGATKVIPKQKHFNT